MKCYVANSETNYGPLVHVVMADSVKEAFTLAVKDGAWDDCVVTELYLSSTEGVIWCCYD
jgi:hypothetical protein